MSRHHIGTSGWHYPHWVERFYPAELPKDEWLAWYAQRLPAVEINASFYQSLTLEQVEHWRAAVPIDFTFAVKAPRYITHLRKLRDCGDALARFLAPLAGFGHQLGPLLFQLPPRWRRNATRLAAFLKLLPGDHRCAFEFRDPDWHHPEIYELLEEHGAAFCIFDLAGETSPLACTADFVYVRLHGPAGAYAGRYSAAALKRWATHIAAWQRQHKDVYLYFNNDQAGYAVKNTLYLNDYLRELAP